MFLVFLALVAPSRASGIDVPTLGTGLSGPTTADAASIYWNPAMLADLDRGQLILGAGLVGGAIGYERNRLGQYQYADTLQFQDPLPDEYIDPSRSGVAEKVSTVPLAPDGDVFFASPKIADRLVLAGALYVPYAAPLNYDPEGAQRFQLQGAFIAVTHIHAAAAVELQDNLQMGAGVVLVSSLGSISRVQDFAGVDPFRDALENPPINQPNNFGLTAPSTLRELDVLARPFTFTDGESLGIDFNVGFGWQPTDKIGLGIVYHHGSRLNFHGDFAMDMDHPFFTTDLAAQGLAYDPLVTGTGTLSFRLPNRVIAGLSAEVADGSWLDLQLAWVHWSALKSFDLALQSPGLAQPAVGLADTLETSLPRGWVDTVHVETRFRTELSEKALLAVTTGYHSPASPDETIDAASPDGHRLLGAGTTQLRVSDRTVLIGDLEIQGILPRTVTTSAYDLANGRYTMVIGAAMGHLQIDLGKNP